jgi:hypothetical protein
VLPARQWIFSVACGESALTLKRLQSTRMGMMERSCAEAKAVMMMLEVVVGSRGSTSMKRVDLGLISIRGVKRSGGYYLGS